MKALQGPARTVVLAVAAWLSTAFAVELDSVVAYLTASLDQIETYSANACITECG
jgi:hypothetical protein